MASYLDFEGKYNPDRRFVVNNWTDQDLNSFWDSRPILIKAGDMREDEMAVAYKLTKELVDREILKDAQKAVLSSGAVDHATREKVRERGEMAVLNKDLRKPYEDKTISEIRPGEANPIMEKMRAEIRKEMEAEKNVASAPDTAMQNDVAATKVILDPAAESTPKKVTKRRTGEEFSE